MISQMWEALQKGGGGVRDFAAGPVVKTVPLVQGREGLIPGRGTKIPHVTRFVCLKKDGKPFMI